MRNWVVLFLLIAFPVQATEMILSSGIENGLPTSSTEFASFQGTNNWTTSESASSKAVPAPGTFSDLRISLTVAPGAGNSYVFTVNKGTLASMSATAVTCTITGASATTCNSGASTFSISTGDIGAAPPSNIITLEANPDSTPTSAVAHWSIKFDSDETSETLLMGNSTANDWNTGRFLTLIGSEGDDGTQFDKTMVMPGESTMKDFMVVLDTAPGAGNSRSFELTNTSSAVTCTISNTETSCMDTGTLARDILDATVASQPSDTGTPASSGGKVSVIMVADTEGQFIYPSASDDALSAFVTEYGVFNGDFVWGTTETERDSLTGAAEVLAIAVAASQGPGTGDTFTFKVRADAANLTNDITCDIAGSGNSCCASSVDGVTCDSITSDAFTDDQLISIQKTIGGVPGGSVKVHASFLGFIDPGAAADVISTTLFGLSVFGATTN